MPHIAHLGAPDIDTYLQTQAHKSLLRFVTCGSVDDGKSTLIGRLLYDAKRLFEDQLNALTADSQRFGTQGAGLDFALLVDELTAEREQGITIDVAYRFFSTSKRTFIVADTPGHEHYTRHMVTGASTADLALILIDARKGVLTQTRRHTYLVSLLGIHHVVLAVNKMDLVDFSQDRFDTIVAEYTQFTRQIGLPHFLPMPISGLQGHNIVSRSQATPWYHGPALLEYLETVEIDAQRLAREAFRLPVQWVSRPNPHFRGFAGLIVSGIVHPGDSIQALPAGTTSHIARIVTIDGDLPCATAGQSVLLTLADDIDISRGDLLVAADQPLEIADQFEATIISMVEEPLLPSRQYWLKIGTKTVVASITELKYQVDVNTLEHLAAKTLTLNAIGVCNIALDQPIAFAPYKVNKDCGGFILIDRLTNATIAAGMIHFALWRSQNLQWQTLDLDKATRAAMNRQKPVVLWFTGLSGAGKSTIANLVEKRLYSLGRRTYLLDGDNIRHGLNRDLGFTNADRVENIRRVAEVAKLFVDAGLIVLTAFISPFRAERQMARALMAADEFIEIFVDTPLAVAEMRDVKGLYKKARAGQLKNFTGIDSPYETPEAPDIHIQTTQLTPEEAATQIIESLRERGILEQS